jgi:hypothetical protein
MLLRISVESGRPRDLSQWGLRRRTATLAAAAVGLLHIFTKHRSSSRFHIAILCYYSYYIIVSLPLEGCSCCFLHPASTMADGQPIIDFGDRYEAVRAATTSRNAELTAVQAATPQRGTQTSCRKFLLAPPATTNCLITACLRAAPKGDMLAACCGAAIPLLPPALLTGARAWPRHVWHSGAHARCR